MKAAGTVVQICFFVLLLVESGCEPGPVGPALPTDSDSNLVSAYTAYAPEESDIMPLTEFIRVGGAERASQIRVYVGLLDSFDCQIKTPGVFRFELYEYVQRSAEPKGRRIIIWPDVDLTGAAENNIYWRDYFRAYEFNLDFGPERNRSYILQATCLCPTGRRLSDDYVLTYAE